MAVILNKQHMSRIHTAYIPIACLSRPTNMSSSGFCVWGEWFHIRHIWLPLEKG